MMCTYCTLSTAFTQLSKSCPHQNFSDPYFFLRVSPEEAQYIESWPNTSSAWAGWSILYIPEDRYGGVHSLLQCTGVSHLPQG
jgi:hypothetical protein